VQAVYGSLAGGRQAVSLKVGLRGMPSPFAGRSLSCSWAGPVVGNTREPELIAHDPPSYPSPPSLTPCRAQELMRGLWGTGDFKKGEVEAVVADMVSSTTPSQHTHGEESEGGAADCPACGTPPATDLAPAARVYLSLRRLVDAHALSCISVRCFDIVTAKETSGGWVGGFGRVVKGWQVAGEQQDRGQAGSWRLMQGTEEQCRSGSLLLKHQGGEAERQSCSLPLAFRRFNRRARGCPSRSRAQAATPCPGCSMSK